MRQSVEHSSVFIQAIQVTFIMLFFLHGVLYFFYPEDIHNSSSVIKLIKYILIILFVVVFSLRVKFHKIISGSFLFIVLLVFYMLANLFVISEKLLLFLIPMLFVYIYIAEFKNISLILTLAFVVYIVASVVAYLEYFFFNGIFSRFGFGEFGYRISSVFINPNNCGLVILFISIFMIENTKNSLVKFVIYLNTFLVILLTISKTALILLCVYLLFKFFRQVVVLSVATTLFLLPLLQNEIEIDTVLASLYHRAEYNELFFNLANDNIFFPFLNSVQYTDNIYLQIWGYFGFFVVVVFGFFNLFMGVYFLLKKAYIKLLVLILFLLTGLTTNFLYTWPLSYMYWAFIFYNLHRAIINRDLCTRGARDNKEMNFAD